METNRVSRIRRSKEQVEVFPQPEADARLQGGGKQDFTFPVANRFRCFSGIRVAGVPAVDPVDVPCADCGVQIEGDNVFLAEMEVSSHEETAGKGIDIGRSGIDEGTPRPDHQSERPLPVNSDSSCISVSPRDESCICPGGKLRFPVLPAFLGKSLFHILRP